jgi:hypothetical protein
LIFCDSKFILQRIALFHNPPSGSAKRTVFEQVKGLAKKVQIDVYTLTTADRGLMNIANHTSVISVPFHLLPLFQYLFRPFNKVKQSLNIMHLRSGEWVLSNIINNEDYDADLVHPCQFTRSPSVIQFLSIPTVHYAQDVNRLIYDPYIKRPYLQR